MKLSFEFRNTIIYILLGFLWIVFTSEAVLLITLSPEQIAKIEVYKGLVYVLITGMLLFYLMRRRIKVEKFLFGKLRETRKELIKSKEKLVEKNKSLEEYAFITSHNLRRPLANILGLVQLFDEKKSDDDLNKEVIEKLKTSAEELDEVIKQTTKVLNKKNDDL
jgi:signal transduction histidine kinase